MTSRGFAQGIVHPKAIRRGHVLGKRDQTPNPEAILANLPFPPSFQKERMETGSWGEGVESAGIERFVESEDEDDGQAELEALAQVELDLLSTSQSWPSMQDEPYLLRKAHTAEPFKPCKDEDADDLGLEKAAKVLRRSCPLRYKDVPERALNPMCRDPLFVKEGDNVLTSLVTCEEAARTSVRAASRKSTRPSLFSFPAIVTSKH